MICPNCGYQHSGQSYAAEIDGVRLPRSEYDIVLRLRQAAGAMVSNEALVEFVYGDRPDGGPETARKCIHAFVCRAKKKIEPTGWTVRAERFRGYQLVRNADV